MPAPQEMTPSQLLRLVGTPDFPVLLDLRLDEDFAENPRLIPTALRVGYDDPKSAFSHLASRTRITICFGSMKISQGAMTRAPAASPSAQPQEPSLWVTRERPKIDPITCPRHNRCFINPWAQFLLIGSSEVLAAADRFQTIPFDAMLADYGLASDPLDRLATVIRAADTNQHHLAPEAAGLLALSVGLSRHYPDDLEHLEAALPLYDALYRWARDGAGETHDWVLGTGQ